MLMQNAFDGHFLFTDLEYSEITISGKCRSRHHHKVVLNCASGIWEEEDEQDFNKEVLEELMGSLSLAETSHVQFVAGLMSMVYNRTDIASVDPEDFSCGDFPFLNYPILREAMVYLKDKICERGTDELDET